MRFYEAFTSELAKFSSNGSAAGIAQFGGPTTAGVQQDLRRSRLAAQAAKRKADPLGDVKPSTPTEVPDVSSFFTKKPGRG